MEISRCAGLLDWRKETCVHRNTAASNYLLG